MERDALGSAEDELGRAAADVDHERPLLDGRPAATPWNVRCASSSPVSSRVANP